MAEPARKPAPVKIRPRIGRWESAPDGEVTLIGSRCPFCNETFFPALSTCAKCGRTEMQEARINGPARLGAFTIVHQAPAGFSTPLAVGYGEFDGGVLVLAPIDGPLDRVTSGMVLGLHEGPTWVDEDGEPMVSYRFRPVGG